MSKTQEERIHNLEKKVVELAEQNILLAKQNAEITDQLLRFAQGSAKQTDNIDTILTMIQNLTQPHFIYGMVEQSEAEGEIAREQWKRKMRESFQ